MKVISNFLEVGEYNAIAASAMLWDSATAAEQKNGYLAQVLHEFVTRISARSSTTISPSIIMIRPDITTLVARQSNGSDLRLPIYRATCCAGTRRRNFGIHFYSSVCCGRCGGARRPPRFRFFGNRARRGVAQSVLEKLSIFPHCLAVAAGTGRPGGAGGCHPGSQRMKQPIVTTTIYVPKALERYAENARFHGHEQISFVVVGTRRLPRRHAHFAIR